MNIFTRFFDYVIISKPVRPIITSLFFLATLAFWRNNKNKKKSNTAKKVIAGTTTLPNSNNGSNTNISKKRIRKSKIAHEKEESKEYLSYQIEVSIDEQYASQEATDDVSRQVKSLKQSIVQYPALLKLLPLLAEHGGCISGSFVSSALKGSINNNNSDSDSDNDVDELTVDIWVPYKDRVNKMSKLVCEALGDMKIACNAGVVPQNKVKLSSYLNRTAHVNLADRSDTKDLIYLTLIEDLKSGKKKESDIWEGYGGLEGLLNSLSPRAKEAGLRGLVTRVGAIKHFKIISTNRSSSSSSVASSIPANLPLFFHPFSVDYKDFMRYNKRFCTVCDADVSTPFNCKTCPGCACGWYEIKSFVYRVLNQVHPSISLSDEASRFLVDILDRLCHSLLTNVSAVSEGKEVDKSHFIKAINKVLVNQLAKHAVSELTKALVKAESNRKYFDNPSNKTRSGSSSENDKYSCVDDNVIPNHPFCRSIILAAGSFSGLQFDPEVFMYGLNNYNIKSKSIWKSAVILASVSEYMLAELLELSGNDCRDSKRSRIGLRNVISAISCDAELLETVASLYSDNNNSSEDSSSSKTTASTTDDITVKPIMSLQVFEMINLDNKISLKGSLRSVIESYKPPNRIGITVTKLSNTSFRLQLSGPGIGSL